VFQRRVIRIGFNARRLSNDAFDPRLLKLAFGHPAQGMLGEMQFQRRHLTARFRARRSCGT
jgi:hypothetical protein